MSEFPEKLLSGYRNFMSGRYSDERERYRDPRASHAAPARDASGAALAAPGAGVQRSGSKQGRKSGVPAGLQAADGGRTAALRQGGANADYASGGGAGSGYAARADS